MNHTALVSRNFNDATTEEGSVGFDFDSVERAVSGDAAADALIEAADGAVTAEHVAQFKAALDVLIDLVLPVGGARSAKAVGVKMLAIIHLVRPGAIGDKTLRALAQDAEITAARLSKVMLTYRQEWGLRVSWEKAASHRTTLALAQMRARDERRELRRAKRRAEAAASGEQLKIA